MTVRITRFIALDRVGLLVACTLFLTPTLQAQPAAIRLTKDLRITETTSVAPETYRIQDPDDDGAVVILGDNTTVDVRGATLIGTAEMRPADGFIGRGLVIRGNNVTVRNLKVRGFKIGILADGAPGIVIDQCDVSRNYRQRLKSTVDHEDLSDWLYGHENDNDEWLRYGAGIYLRNCPKATVSNCRARNGQNGLCLVRCDRSHVVDNDMSFMSGWGLAMWRSSHCGVFNNKFDWCLRGYSHGIYSRGQDSAGILVYEQCIENIFAFNSATHSGDGFFLYAGNETLRKTGVGGCNRNLVYRNDFSHAAANGTEATFSHENRFLENILDECEHGVWAGYSSDTIIQDNIMRDCRNGVSIEHGSGNRILSNTFENTPTGVHLWWDDDEDLLASAFGKANNGCLSRGNVIATNRFDRAERAVWLENDSQSQIGGNVFHDVDVSLAIAGGSEGIKAALAPEAQKHVRRDKDVELEFVDSISEARIPPLRLSPEERTRIQSKKGKQDAFLRPGMPRGKRYIFVDEWGPYDFTDVRMTPNHAAAGAKASFQILGPPGTPFRVLGADGEVDVAPRKGEMPVKLKVSSNTTGVQDFAVRIEAGSRQLRATGTLVQSDWRVAVYSWSHEDDPRSGDEAWRRIVARKPIAVFNAPEVNFRWGYGGPAAGAPVDHFATVVSTTIDLPEGMWRISTVSDDGIRVFVDGQQVLADWTHHGPTPLETQIELEAGAHEFRVEHFEIDGYAQLSVRLEPLK